MSVEGIVDAVADAMIEDGPDGHTDGCEKITAAALRALAALAVSDPRVGGSGGNYVAVALIERLAAEAESRASW